MRRLMTASGVALALAIAALGVSSNLALASVNLFAFVVLEPPMILVGLIAGRANGRSAMHA